MFPILLQNPVLAGLYVSLRGQLKQLGSFSMRMIPQCKPGCYFLTEYYVKSMDTPMWTSVWCCSTGIILIDLFCYYPLLVFECKIYLLGWNYIAEVSKSTADQV